MKQGFSLIVPTWGRSEAVLARLFDSLARLAPAERRLIVEVVLADQNTPPLDHRKLLSGPAKKVFAHLSLDGNSGKGRIARPGAGKVPLLHCVGLAPSVTRSKNLAVSLSSAPWLLFLDDDVAVLPGCLRIHAQIRRKCTGLGGLGGRETVIAPDGSEQPGESGLDRLVARFYARRSAEQAWLWQGRFVGRVTRQSFFLCDYSLPVTGHVRADVVRGCHWSLGREAFETVGGFDTGYQGTALREESEMQLRVQSAGYENRFTGDARVLHYRGAGGCRNLSGTLGVLRSKLVNETRFQLQHFRRPIVLFFALRILPHVIGSLRSTRGLSPFLWLQAISRFWYLKHFNQARERWLRKPDAGR